MSVTTKKMQIYPIGDPEEVRRVYNYIRDDIYNQYKLLNIYMGQMIELFYEQNMDTGSELFQKKMEEILADTEKAMELLELDQAKAFTRNLYNGIKSAETEDYKEKKNKIFRNTNKNIESIKQAKGLAMTGNCGQQVRADFNKAIKNGLARGECRAPFYKRNFPLLVPSRFINFYTTQVVVQKEDGSEEKKEIFAFKFVNGIHFKVILGSKNRDYMLAPLLDKILTDPEHHKVCGSKIQLREDGKIMLLLSVDITSREKENYDPVEGRTMGLAMGYDKCLVAALSDSDEVFELASEDKESIINKRIDIQNRFRTLFSALKEAKGGHGRKRKLDAIKRQRAYEKNIVLKWNHELSNKVIEFAKKHKVSTIIIEPIEKRDLKNYPTLLRNWSYFQLNQFINYKATGVGISVKESENPVNVRMCCCKCGCKLEKENIFPVQFEWCNEFSFTCPNCDNKIEYSYNKAKNMTVMG